MPPVDAAAVKARAAALRDKGRHAKARYLNAQVGLTQEVLMERAHLGRTASYANVSTETPASEGSIRNIRITGCGEEGLMGSFI